MFGIGPMELVVIVVLALLIFGPQRLPELARNLGKGLAEFRRASNELRQTLALDDLQNELRKTIHQPGNPAPPRPAQAGDTLPAGAAGANVPSTDAALTSTPPSTPPSPDTSASSASSASSAATPGAGSPSTAGTIADAAPAPPWKGHPGELPLDRDHEHNDPTPDPAARPRLAAADPGLGNVPVTGADPSGTRRG